MKTGIHFHCTDEAFPPLDFARMVEDEGIESIWLPDHSHVPVASRVPVEDKAQYGGVEGQLEKSFAKSPGSLPREYYRNHDQLIAIAMMGGSPRPFCSAPASVWSFSVIRSSWPRRSLRSTV